jgi:hypothetical protein
METKIYSSSGFSHACSAEELYVITRHWLSDIIFFEQEITFFKSLIQNYSLPYGETDFESPCFSIQKQLADIEKQKDILKDSIFVHQNELSTILDKNNTEKQHSYNLIQSQIEAKLFDFIKTFRSVKRELFEASDYILKAKPKNAFV